VVETDIETGIITIPGTTTEEESIEEEERETELGMMKRDIRNEGDTR
jgi:hypothetical protein